MDDNKIIELFFMRSEQAIAETKLKYNKLCMTVAERILFNSEDAEECVSSAYLRLWNAIPPKNPDSLCGYLCKIVRNIALTAFSKISRHSYEKQYEELSEVIMTKETVEEQYESRDISRMLNEFLGVQKRRSREIFTARYFFNMSIKEISESMSMTETAVRSRLLRTRNELKEYLKERGVTV